MLLGSIALYVQSSKRPIIRPNKIVYPPASGGSANNRIYQIVREPSDLEPLLIGKLPLLLNFVRLGETASNKLTTALQDVVGTQMVKESRGVNMVSIEVDNVENLDLTVKYQVNDIPSVLCLKKQLPSGRYVDKQLNADPDEKEVNLDALTQWVREHSSDVSGSSESKEK